MISAKYGYFFLCTKKCIIFQSKEHFNKKNIKSYEKFLTMQIFDFHRLKKSVRLFEHHHQNSKVMYATEHMHS